MANATIRSINDLGEDRIRVRIKNTLLFNNRTGVLIPNSGKVDDIWDFHVLLDPVTPPEGATRIDSAIYGERTIGIQECQIERLSA